MIHQDIEIEKDDWTLVSDGFRNVSVQMTGVGAVVVRCLPAAAPAPASSDESGAQIQNAGSSFAAGGLPDGTKVYARSKRDGNETVNVLAY